MTDDIAIKVENVSKAFKLPHEKQTSIKSALINFGRTKKGYERQQVLKDVTFEIKKGEFFGIVGRNGSGKSTLLKLLAGIYAQDSGGITVKGKLTPFIELGVGFNPDLSGRENVFLNGALLGFNRKEMEAMYDDIVKFAELERFMDQKLKNYSSGMQVRLAFSIAIRAKGDILLLDEVLAVGDAIFQKKCYDYFKQLKKEKRTVVFVSHDAGALKEYCTNGILLEGGKIIKEGRIDTIVNDYIDLLNKSEMNQEIQKATKQWGTGQAVVKELSFTTQHSKTNVYKENDNIEFEVVFQSNEDVDKPIFGITITDLAGQVVFQSNTLWREVQTSDMKNGQEIRVAWSIPNAFNTGTFIISPAISDKTGTIVYNWNEDMARFKVSKKQKSHGVVNLEHNLKIV